MRINTNVSSLTAQENAVNTNNAIKSSLEKLSSGLRINKASDDASGLAIADKLRTQATSINQGVANGNSAVSLLQIADKSMAEQSNILNTVKSKLIQANTDTTSAEGREAIRKDISKLLEQLDNIAEQTNYNGKTLLQAGSGDTETDRIKSAGLAFQIGESNTDVISNKAIQSNTDGLGLAAKQESTTTLVAQNESTYEISVNGTSVSFKSDKDATLDEIHAGLKAAIEGNAELNALVTVEPQDKASTADSSKLVLTAKESNKALNVDAYVNNSVPDEPATATLATKTAAVTTATKEVNTLTFKAADAATTGGATASVTIGGKTFTLTGTAALTSGAKIATGLAALINADGDFTATATGGVITITDDSESGDITATAGGTVTGTLAETTKGVAKAGPSQKVTVDAATGAKFTATFGGNTISATGNDEATLLANLETAFNALGTTDYTFTKDDAKKTFTIAMTDSAKVEADLDLAVSTSIDTGKLTVSTTKGSEAKAAVAEVNTLTFKAGDAATTGGATASVTIGGKTFTLTGTAALTSGAKIASGLAALIDADGDFSATVAGGVITITDDSEAGDLTVTAAGTVTGTVDETTKGEAAVITPTKTESTVTVNATVTENTRYNVKIGNESIDYTAKKGDTTEDVVKGLKASFEANKVLNSSEDTGFSIETTANTLKITANAGGEKDGVTGNNTLDIEGKGNFTAKDTIEAGEGKALSELKNLEANGLTKELAAEFQAVVDDAINDLNAYRGDIGSTQNQVESAVRNLMTQATNVKAAESIIRDVDYAAESSNFNKQNIIAQAGSYAISQANSAQKNVMKLLQ